MHRYPPPVGIPQARVIQGPPPASASFEEEEHFSFKPVGVSALDSGSGE